MFTGIVGVVIGYIIIVSLLIWFMIFSKGKLILKVCAIAFSVYYAIGLYAMLPTMQGWPTSQDIPDKSNVIAIRILEPKGADPGAFFIWCNTRPRERVQAANLLSPTGMFVYAGGIQPRAFKMPYDRELHKKITKAQKQKKKMGGWLQIVKGKKGTVKGGKGDPNAPPNDQLVFRVVNPVDILTKPDVGE